MTISEQKKQLRPKRLGEMLVSVGMLSQAQIEEGLKLAKERNKRLGEVLVDDGYISDIDLAKILADQYALEYIDLKETKIDPVAVNHIPENIAKEYCILPVCFDQDGSLVLVVNDPLNVRDISVVQRMLKVKYKVKVCPNSQLESALSAAYKDAEESSSMGLVEDISINVDNIVDISENISIEKYVNDVILRAIRGRASDIHIEPSPEFLRVRIRIDGVLHEERKMSLTIYPPLVSKLKIMANLDIAEKRLPQDGSFQQDIGSKKVDFRLSTLPTIRGEKVVIRILDQSAQNNRLIDLDFHPEFLKTVRELIRRPYGMLLVTGPTGSGKTTSVYAMLRDINNIDKNIITIEDPVEYQIDLINQVQTNRKAGVTFANTLRSILRQDPDVIMVGEIRDAETAEIAIRASLTGHLVISTLHTNDSVATITRLIDMGIEPVLLSSSLLGIIAQRLMRRLCKNCKELKPITKEEYMLMNNRNIPQNVQLAHPVGCGECANTGYRGRIAIHELLVPNREIRRLMNHKNAEDKIIENLRQQKFHSLRLDALQKVLNHESTLAELIKATA